MKLFRREMILPLALLIILGTAAFQINNYSPGLTTSGPAVAGQIGVYSTATNLTGYSGLTSDSSGNVTATSVTTTGSQINPFVFSVYVIGGQTAPCGDATGRTEGYGFVAPFNGVYGHIWIDIATADNTAGHNYTFGILAPNAGRTDFSVLGKTTAAPTGAGTGWTSFALNQNITLIAGQEYVVACSVAAGNSATFFSPFSPYATFTGSNLSTSVFPASGYTVPAISYVMMPSTGIAAASFDFGLTP